MIYLYIGIGGVIGSLLRFFISYMSEHVWKAESFPIGTLITNILGAYLLGFVTNYFGSNDKISRRLQLAIGTGAIGSFTTLSTLSTDTVLLLERGVYFYAFLYVFLSVFGGLFAVYFGLRRVEVK
ncbi:fluoride efflux transporter CrcB [Cytobacillus depressus]|uniref:fluoride efflux transporter CrcB n=1 Tax=Cytobacillus depressus TaxID=1602942 RepID=UPI001FE4D1EF|nr:fluoride efflux transporter CrcB [Cytobacillus depressus]